MQNLGNQLLSTRILTRRNVEDIFAHSSRFKTEGFSSSRARWEILNPLVALVFLEPSTRTRLSFEIAAKRLGLACVELSAGSTTSLIKGESLVDTLSVVAAMQPDLLVVRHGPSSEVDTFLESCPLPIISGGNGVSDHPSQALLDAFTLWERWGTLKGKNILFIGDVDHSRVFGSHLSLLPILGANVGICGPTEFTQGRNQLDGVTHFMSLAEGLQWANACMPLRIQKERHKNLTSEAIDQITSQFQINKQVVQGFRSDQFLMHPGPYVDGEELTSEAAACPQSLILEQVKNGVFIRAALLDLFLTNAMIANNKAR